MNTDQKKDGREYASDLNDKEWELIQHFFDTTGKWGRPPRICCRKILNAIFYQLRTSCQWQMLPTNLPHHPHMFPKAEREWIYSTHFAPNEYRNERVLMEIVRIKSVDSRQRQRKEAIPLFDRPNPSLNKLVRNDHYRSTLVSRTNFWLVGSVRQQTDCEGSTERKMQRLSRNPQLLEPLLQLLVFNP